MAAPLVVHQRVIDVLASVGATCWTTYPVEVRNQERRVVTGFFGLAISGRSGPIDVSRSDSQGSISSRRFATERVVKALTKARVRNLTFERLIDKEVDTSVYTIGMQYRLPADYGDRLDRAYRTANVERPSWT